MMSDKSLQQLDKSYVWHPFTQMRDWQDEEILVIERGEGCCLIDTEGRRYIDGVSSLWCNVHGHRKEKIDQAIRDQLDRVAHSTFLGLSNVPAVLLAERLIQIAPLGLTRVFYSDSGSEAMEIALKIAYQYWQQRQDAKPKKKKFVHLDQAYHGDTIGSVSVGGIDLFHKKYEPLLFETWSIPAPLRVHRELGIRREECRLECVQSLEDILEKHHEEIAAVVIEPLMQGAAGMIDQPAGYLSKVRELTRRWGVLLICDEVATGFGRTGKMFACDHESVTPDIMALAKGLTGGYLPLAATLVSEEIYQAFLGEYGEFKTFFHGHTYTANPLACAAALANLDIFEKEKTLEHLQPKIELMKNRLAKIGRMDHVGDVRQVGFMAGIELVKEKSSLTPYGLEEKMGIRVCQRARKYGVILRPLGNVIVLMPPLGIPENLLTELLDVVEKCIREID